MLTTLFISSTSRDLLDHRAAVAKGLLNAGYHPIDMANFMARPEGATSACLKEVAESDLFVGVYAWRYGYIPPGAEVSITEQEFIEAERLAKPCFIFMADETYPWPETFKEEGLSARLLRDFKARLDARLVRTTFTSPEDLAMKVLASLQRYERDHPIKPKTETAQERAMSDESKQSSQIGGVNISGISGGSINVGGNISANVQAGGNIVGGDYIANQTPAEAGSAQAILEAALAQWKQEVDATLEKANDLDKDDKTYLQTTAAKVEEEAKKGEAADPSIIESFLKKMSNMAPDILEVTAKTLQNPFAGVGLVLQKINDRIKLEREVKN
jgi:hypothetical protein